MSAFVVVDIDIHDPAGYEDYKKLSGDTVARYGGRYLARGGRTETLEGDWTCGRFVIIEFESVARAREWLDSPEYTPVKAIRHRTARSDMIVVEGV